MWSKEQYVMDIKQKFESEAVRKNWNPSSLVQIDWGELQFILSDVVSRGTSNNIDIKCSIDEDLGHVLVQPVITPNYIASQEHLAHWMFLEEKNLIEEYEYFLHDLIAKN